MFDIKQYYKQAHSGERVENSDLLNHIKKYPPSYFMGREYSWRSCR